MGRHLGPAEYPLCVLEEGKVTVSQDPSALPPNAKKETCPYPGPGHTGKAE